MVDMNDHHKVDGLPEMVNWLHLEFQVEEGSLCIVLRVGEFLGINWNVLRQSPRQVGRLAIEMDVYQSWKL